jgi:hypothetical protein
MGSLLCQLVQDDGAISPENPGRLFRMTLKTFEIRGL